MRQGDCPMPMLSGETCGFDASGLLLSCQYIYGPPITRSSGGNGSGFEDNITIGSGPLLTGSGHCRSLALRLDCLVLGQVTVKLDKLLGQVVGRGKVNQRFVGLV